MFSLRGKLDSDASLKFVLWVPHLLTLVQARMETTLGKGPSRGEDGDKNQERWSEQRGKFKWGLIRDLKPRS